MRSAPAPVLIVSRPPPPTRSLRASRRTPSTKSTAPLSPNTRSAPMPVVMASLPEPPSTTLSPSPARIVSSPATLSFLVETRTSLPCAKVAVPSSPRMMSRPAPVVMSSAPTPPKTTLSPSPAAMVSPPPKLDSIVSTETRTPSANTAPPLSPRITSAPEPVRIASAPTPPMTTLPPSPRVISSRAPAVAAVVATRSTRPCASKVAWPLSPSTVPRPLPAAMASPPEPPRITATPSPTVIVSSPPTLSSVVSTRIGRPAAVNRAWPASPMMTLVAVPTFTPSLMPALIVSAPAPPIAVLRPLPTAIVSRSPTSGLLLVISTMMPASKSA
ncbi:hypothetical protein CHKEEEPN_3432 [Methylorubrum podarium]|nr:hypothetical protein CHKEEEPN_3432 [Methylorubrum podarium]